MAGDGRWAKSLQVFERFNPRPRMAGDVCADGRYSPVNHVSIHARVWRATAIATNTVDKANVSIHARVWRATLSF